MTTIKELITILNDLSEEDKAGSLFIGYNAPSNDPDCTLWTEQMIIDRANNELKLPNKVTEVYEAIDELADYDSTYYYLEVIG